MRNSAIVVSLRVMSRITYDIDPITVNNLEISKVVIDDHYKRKHCSYLNDQLILKIICRLDGRKQLPESQSDEFSYFATLLEYQGKRYRVV